MKTPDSPQQPVHVHVPETTPVHVHMRRSSSKTSQNSANNSHLIGRSGGRPKVRTPWIPPGRPSSRRDLDSCHHQRGRRSESGTGHHRDVQEPEEEIDALSKNLLCALLKEQADSMSHLRDKDGLLRALVEAEIDGVALANQLASLKETADSLSKDKLPSRSHLASLRRQQETLLEKMEVFSHTNHSLRELLSEWSEYERDLLVWAEQKDDLRRRMEDSEAENIRISAKLSDKEEEASKLAEHLDFEKDKINTTEELSRILQSTCGHLESELNRTQAEKNRLADQLERTHRSHERQQEELLALQEELLSLKQRGEEERKENELQNHGTLALITQQAEQSEEHARQLAFKLQEKEAELAETLFASSDWCQRHSREAAAKQQLEEETSVLKLQVSALKSRLLSAEERSRTEREELRDQLHHVSAENASSKLDNQKLKAQVTSSEEKLGALHSEARHLKSAIRKQESLVEKHKKKVQHARLESDGYILKLETAQKETEEVKQRLEREKEQVRQELLGRLKELETMSDSLRRTELQLGEAQQEAVIQERRNMEHKSSLCDLRLKVEQQGTQLETFQQKNLLLQEESNVLREKIHNLERKLEDLKVENKGMCQALSLRETSVQNLQERLEEKARECGALSRQLQQTLDDAQTQVDNSMQRLLAKERESQSKALDLQSQLTKAKTEQSRLQRSKEEMERRFQSQLQNMKDRLERSDSTNRSLQNYVQFLKSTYGNTIGDSYLSS